MVITCGKCNINWKNQCDWCGKLEEGENPNFFYHVWCGAISGITWSIKFQEPPKTFGNEKLKYLGKTKSISYPIKLSTGRVLIKPNKRHIKKQNKRKKLCI